MPYLHEVTVNIQVIFRNNEAALKLDITHPLMLHLHVQILVEFGINGPVNTFIYGGTVVNLYQWFEEKSIFNGSVTLEAQHI